MSTLPPLEKFLRTPMHVHYIYIAFDKCVYSCDVVVEKSLYITFIIHKRSLHSKSMHNEA